MTNKLMEFEGQRYELVSLEYNEENGAPIIQVQRAWKDYRDGEGVQYRDAKQGVVLNLKGGIPSMEGLSEEQQLAYAEEKWENFMQYALQGREDGYYNLTEGEIETFNPIADEGVGIEEVKEYKDNYSKNKRSKKKKKK